MTLTVTNFNQTVYMKRLLSFGLVLSLASAEAQTFEWNEAPRPAAHPKEVQVDAASNSDKQAGLAGVYAPAADGSPTAYGEVYSAAELTGSHSGLPLGTLLRVTNTENGRSVVVRVTDKGKECTDCLITLSQAAAEQLGISVPSQVSLERTGFSNWNPVSNTVAKAEITTREESGIIAPRTKTSSATAAAPRPQVISREVTPTPVAAEEDTDAPKTYTRYAVTPPAPTVPGATQQARGGAVAVPVASPAPAPETAEFAVQLAAYHNETYAQRRVDELKEQGLKEVFYRSITKEDGQVVNRVYAGKYQTVNEAQEEAARIEKQYQLTGIVAKM